MKTKQPWAPSDITFELKYLSSNILEFRDDKGEWHEFYIIVTPIRIVFGGACNVGFIESGYIERDDCETLDETLSELLSELEAFYNDGPEYVSRIIHNKRM